MKEFEEIAHTGGKVIIENGQIKFEHKNPFPIVMYDILVSMNGIILGRGTFGREPEPQPSIQVMMGSDKEGFFGYTCPRCQNYFRATHLPLNIICPYCLYIDNTLHFLTKNQLKYIELFYNKFVESLVDNKRVIIDLDELISKLDNNLIKLSAYEVRMQCILECRNCKIIIDFIGVYAGCPSCGKRNNLDKFLKEIEQIKKNNTDSNKSLSSAVEVYAGLGSNVKLILENNIPFSSFHKKNFNKIDFQKIIETNDIFIKVFGVRLFPEEVDTTAFINLMFQRRHVIAHRSGIADKKYLEKTNDSSVKMNQKITIKPEELIKFLNLLSEITEKFISELEIIIDDYIDKNKYDYQFNIQRGDNRSKTTPH